MNSSFQTWTIFIYSCHAFSPNLDNVEPHEADFPTLEFNNIPKTERVDKDLQASVKYSVFDIADYVKMSLKLDDAKLVGLRSYET